jgi:hypothetical protein
LTAFGTALGVATAGCTGSRSDSTTQVVCSAAIAGDDGGLFGLTPDLRSYSGSDGPPVVELVVPVRRSVAADRGLDLIEVDTGGGIQYRLPVDPRNDEPVGEGQRYDADDVVEYAQSLGHVPQAGRYELTALDGSGEPLDSLRIDFRCYRPERTPSE